ncbi:DUF4181 domain-containing protein [Paenibacillus sp. 2TAB26]|uniref:DUF4181 domain-containing protein n=1 Tax=Paenibacillus sp. 2TAB26 TaxID=3233005 RepID=UPI003F9C4D02
MEFVLGLNNDELAKFILHNGSKTNEMGFDNKINYLIYSAERVRGSDLMGGQIGLVGILLVFASLFLRKWIVGTAKKETSDKGKRVSMWGMTIAALIATAIIIFIDLEGNALKWFCMLFIFIVAGFQSFVDWKFLKGSKEYIVTLLVLVIGVTLSYFIV